MRKRSKTNKPNAQKRRNERRGARARYSKYIMLSIGRCKEILRKHNCNLTDDEIKDVRDFLYTLAEIQIMVEKQLAENEECYTIL